MATHRPSRPGAAPRRARWRAGVAACIAAGLVGIAGCGGDDAPIPAAVESACIQDDGVRVTVVGFLRLPESVSLTDTAIIDLFTRRQGGGDRVSVEFVLGTEPNQLERLPDNFTVTSLRARAVDGTVVTISDRVEVEATVARADAAADCVLRDPLVSLAP